MTRLTIIGLLLGLTLLTNGQTIQDKQDVIQKCIDLDDLQQFYHENEVEGRKPLIIYNDGAVPTSLTLIKFGQPIQFMTKEELFFYNKLAYLDFDKCEITPTSADIVFYYDIEGLTIKVTMNKVDGNWTIKTKKLTEK